MRFFVVILYLSLPSHIFAQRIFKRYKYPYVQESFDGANRNWPLRSNVFEKSSIVNGEYILERSAPQGFSIFLSDSISAFNNFEFICSLDLQLSNISIVEKHLLNKNNTTAGLVIHANQNPDQALVVQFNAKKGYRILQFKENYLIDLHNKSDDGWVTCRSLKSLGKHKVRLRSFRNVFDLYIDEKYQSSFEDKLNTKGKFGFFVDANSSFKVDDIQINLLQNEIVKKSVEEQHDAELFDLVKLLRTKINRQREENLALKQELLSYQNLAIQDTVNLGKIERLESQLDVNRLKNRDLLNRLEKQQRRLDYLETMKSEIEDNQDGDLVMNLMEVLDKEKKTNDGLNKELQKLKVENEELKQKVTDFLKDN
ncbi:MAG: hypothetical protein VXX63_05465 [Bacteroidota bacterium]|nr:hypothetical protein [Bacteroidota bacterium]